MTAEEIARSRAVLEEAARNDWQPEAHTVPVELTEDFHPEPFTPPVTIAERMSGVSVLDRMDDVMRNRLLDLAKEVR